jgi:RNA-splicing ligase RtcB
VLRTHDRFGHRQAEDDFYPAYRCLMQIATGQYGTHAALAVLECLHRQADAGTNCPLTMTSAQSFAVVVSSIVEHWVSAHCRIRRRLLR